MLRSGRLEQGFEGRERSLGGLFGVSKVVGKVDSAFRFGGVLETEACFSKKRIDFVDRFDRRRCCAQRRNTVWGGAKYISG